jgi:hypothetical protein
MLKLCERRKYGGCSEHSRKYFDCEILTAVRYLTSCYRPDRTSFRLRVRPAVRATSRGELPRNTRHERAVIAYDASITSYSMPSPQRSKLIGLGIGGKDGERFRSWVKNDSGSDGPSGRQAAWEEIVLSIHRKFEYSSSIASNTISISVPKIYSSLSGMMASGIPRTIEIFLRQYT